MKRYIVQTYYAGLEIDISEPDIIQVWQYEEDGAVNLIQIERDRLPELINILDDANIR